MIYESQKIFPTDQQFYFINKGLHAQQPLHPPPTPAPGSIFSKIYVDQEGSNHTEEGSRSLHCGLCWLSKRIANFRINSIVNSAVVKNIL